MQEQMSGHAIMEVTRSRPCFIKPFEHSQRLSPLSIKNEIQTVRADTIHASVVKLQPRRVAPQLVRNVCI